MADLVKGQLQSSREVVFSKGNKKEIVKRIANKDKLVDAYELKIDKDCENILALHNPVAVDLRFVLASMKMNHNLEKIGDHAVGVSKLLADSDTSYEEDLLQTFKINEMFDEALAMLDSIIVALTNNDTSLARQIFKKDDFLNENHKRAAKIGIDIIHKDSQKAEVIINLLSMIRKLERVGDLAKNLGMEIIFHVEAKVLRHKKKSKKDK